jgi:hypothetical protein
MPRKPPKDRVVLLSERAMLVADLAILSAKDVLSPKRRKDVIDALERTAPAEVLNFKIEIEQIEKNAIAASLPHVLRSVSRAGDVKMLIQIVNAARTGIVRRIEAIDKQLESSQAQQAAV